MCLMWCHRKRWVVDNDLPCAGCDLGQASALPSAWSCASCQHAQGGLCALTREAQPLADRCCHWQVEPTAPVQLVLGEADIAPWVRASGLPVGALFAASPTAPPLQVDRAGQVVLELADLSVPLVYGVEAAAWDAALGWDGAAPELRWETPLDDARQRAIFDLLGALEEAELEGLEDALLVLLGALEQAAEPLPSGWAVLLADLVRLGREICADEGAIAARFAAVEQLLQRAQGETNQC